MLALSGACNQQGKSCICSLSIIDLRCCRERPRLTESDVAMDFAARLGRPILRIPDQEQVSMFDTLVESVASPRTRKLLQEYQHLAQVCYATGRAPS